MEDVLIAELEIPRIQTDLGRSGLHSTGVVRTYLVRFRNFYSSNEHMVEPKKPTLNSKGLLLSFVPEKFPATRGGAVMHETTPPCHSNQTTIGT